MPDSAARWLRQVTVGSLALGTTGVLALPAFGAAVLPPGEVAVAAVGSSTTDHLMGALAHSAHFGNVRLDIDADTSTPDVTVRSYNIPSVSDLPLGVEGDRGCPDVRWVHDDRLPSPRNEPRRGTPPLTSGEGRDYLSAQARRAGHGSPAGSDTECIDVARTSAGPRPVGDDPLLEDPASFEYYAFALDAVTWASTSRRAPATMTTA